MDNFQLPVKHPSYDLTEELDLINCTYVMPEEYLCNAYNVDLALLCETWLNDKTEKLLKFPNYKIYTVN